MLLVACSKDTSNVSQWGKPSPKKGTSNQTDTAAWVGKYKIDLKATAASKDDVAAKMGEAFAEMLMGGTTLELRADRTFRMLIMTIPLEGKAQIDGTKLTLIPETVMGMTKEKARKLKQQPLPDDKPMEGQFSEDFQTLTLKEIPGDPSGDLKFVRDTSVPKGPGKETVSAAELPLVGSYDGSLKMPEPKNEQERQEQKTLIAMSKSMSLELRRDNTFFMRMVFELEGTWKLQGGKVVLTPTKLVGMEDMKSKTETKPIEGVVEQDGKTLTFTPPDEKDPQLVFTKK